MIDLDLMRVLYRRMDGPGWRVGHDFMVVKQRDGGPTHLDVRWAAEVIREYAESYRHGTPMRNVGRIVRRDGVRNGRRYPRV